MFKRKKDGGFTLIELMIVIAVIGILAIVLVPKVGAIKTQAKAAGLETNLMTVQGYVESRIEKWANDPSITTTQIQNQIVDTLKTEISSPYNQSIAGVSHSASPGVIRVSVDNTNGLKVTLTAYDDKNFPYKKVEITP